MSTEDEVRHAFARQQPLGVMPRNLWLEARARELMRAILDRDDGARNLIDELRFVLTELCKPVERAP